MKKNYMAGILLAAWAFIVPVKLRAQNAALLVQKTNNHLDSLFKTDHFNGEILIAKDGKPVFRKVYGFANLADKIPNTVNTRFNMASMGKMFTGVAILQLVEAGKITLDEKVGHYLPAYPNKSVWDSVTIQQLLTHTSGMGNFWEALDKVAMQHYKTVADYLPLFVNQPLLFKPGTGFNYSNSGYMLLGLIIEAVTKENYFDYITTHIFKPAGMMHTDFYTLDEVNSKLAIGYSRSTEKPGVWLNNNYSGIIKGLPAGGCYTTADDLLNFSNALTAYRLLNAASVKELTTGRVKYEKGMYADGFVEEKVNGHRIIGHGGGNIGIADELMIITDLGYTVVILTNGEVDNYWDIDNFIRKQIVGQTPGTDSYDFTQKLIGVALKNGIESAEKLLRDKPKQLTVRSGLIEQTGNKLLWEHKMDSAVTVCRLNVMAYPGLSFVYLNLADACKRSGNKKEAIEMYQKYIGMEPEDTDAAKQLKQLTGN